MDIGKPERVIIIEPLENPVPEREPRPTPPREPARPAPKKEPVKV